MKTIKYENVIYTYPESWDELMLNKFIELTLIKEDEDELDKMIKIISALTGIPNEKLLDLPYTEFQKIQNACTFVFDDNKHDLQYIIEIDGVKYGFDYDITKMTAAEYFDIDHFIKGGDSVANLHELMAIMYREIIDVDKCNNDDNSKQPPFDYTIVNYVSNDTDKRAKLFLEKMPASAAIAAQFFFLIVGMNCLESTMGFSRNKKNQKQKKMKNNKNNQTTNLPKDGVG